jgi:hypothetical protein
MPGGGVGAGAEGNKRLRIADSEHGRPLWSAASSPDAVGATTPLLLDSKQSNRLQSRTAEHKLT